MELVQIDPTNRHVSVANVIDEKHVEICHELTPFSDRRIPSQVFENNKTTWKGLEQGKPSTHLTVSKNVALNDF